MRQVLNIVSPKRKVHQRLGQQRFSRRRLRDFLKRGNLTIENLEQRNLLAAVPVLVDDLNTTTNTAQISLLQHQGSATIAGVTYFAANDGIHGSELWRSNGTEAGTRMVKDLNTSVNNNSSPRNFVNANGTLYFIAQDNSDRAVIYKSDGTAVGTQAVPGLPGNLQLTGGFAAVGNNVFFTAQETGNPAIRLWVTDGTSIHNLTSLSSTAGTIAWQLRFSLYNVNEKLVFFGNNGVGGIELWSSDGTATNTTQVTNLNPSQSFVNTFNGVDDKLLVKTPDGGDRLYFTGRVSNGSSSMFMTDGTTAGTQSLASVIPSRMANVGGLIYFQAQSSGTGYELWRTDGTTAGTRMVADIVPGYGSSYPQNFFGVGTFVYFRTATDGGPFSYWKTDGTTVEPVAFPDSAGGFTTFNNSVYFNAVDPALGRELFKLDATGTISVLDVAPGAAGSNPGSFLNVGSKLMFVASSGSANGALWSTAGDIASTTMIKDINQTTQGISLSNLIELNGQAYFVDRHGSGELMRTDGTPAGTVQVTNIRPDGLPGYVNSISQLTRAGDALYFVSPVPLSGQRGIWKFDGSTATPVFDEVEPQDLREVGGQLYFTGYSRTTVSQVGLWTSDGTTAGTHKLGFSFRQGTSPQNVREIGGDLFFRGDNGSGEQLWRSDDGQLEAGGQIDSVLVQSDGKLIAIGRSGASLRVARFNADGSVDVTFGQNGRVVNSDLVGSFGTSVIQADGKIVIGTSVAAADAPNYPWRQAAVVRLMPDGSYDASFGNNGVAIVSLPGANHGVYSLALQNIAGQQKIVLSTDPIQVLGNSDMAVVRLNPDGSLDSTFGGDADLDGTPDGFVITDVAGFSDHPSVLLVSPVDQKIIIAGSVETSAGVYRNAVLRYTANGVLDSSYGSNGVAAIANSGTQFESATILADGSVIAAGDSYYREIGNAFVVKLDPSGQLDTTFGDAGSGITFVRSGGEAEGIVQLPGGGFALASRTSGNANVQAVVFRLSATGQLDTAFGNAGFAATNYGEQIGQAWTLSLQTNGGQPKLIVAGSGYNGSTWRWGMARMDLSGNLDSSFGNAGVLSIGAGFRKFSDDLSGTGITRNSDPNEFGGNLYFLAEKAALGTEWQLWVQPYGQGTPLALTSAATLGSTASIARIAPVNGTLYFHVVSGVNSARRELWKSDGTVAGTVLVSVLETSTYASVAEEVAVDGAYYFTMGRAINNEFGGYISNELWVSYGTAASTRMVDSVAVSSDSWGDLIYSLQSSNGKLFYQKFDVATGFELWTYDGTASRLIADIAPGPFSSLVYDIGEETYVFATTPALGGELWRLLDDSNPATTPTLTINDGVAGTVEISRTGNNLVVAKDGLELASYAIGTIVGLTIQGDAESEVFIVDIDGLTSAVLPQGISIGAGEGIDDNDTLILSGSRTVSNYNYTTGGREAGTITIDGFTVLFTEFEPIVDHLNVVNRSFVIGTTGDQQIVLAADGGAGTLLSDGGMGTFESLSFASPSGTFKIVAGDGNDSITIHALDPSFAAELSLDGGLGNDVLNATAYNLSVTLIGGPGDDVLLGGSGNDHIEGGDGNDVIDGGAGMDATNGGSGIDDIIADAEDGQATIGEDSILNLKTMFVAPATATINWGDGTTVAATVDPSSGEVSGSHFYSVAGVYNVTVTAVDSAGAITIKAISVTVIELVAKDGQVFFNSGGIVRIGGTSADDQIVVGAASGKLTVTMNGSLIRNDIPLTQVSEIRAWGHEGNDIIKLVDLAILAMLDGGAGDDELEGGAGDDLLLGGAGNDMLFGGAGNDFLLGGTGFDRLVGAQGHDILVADEVDPILSREDLRSISANWVSGRAVDDGLVSGTTDEVPLEAGFDRLTGGSGSDWFIVGAFDFITDFKKNNKDGDIVTTR